MTIEDVKNIFAPYVYGDEISIGSGQFVSIDFFVTLFGGASASPTYEELMVIDGGTKGYAAFFDQCRDLFN